VVFRAFGHPAPNRGPWPSRRKRQGADSQQVFPPVGSSFRVAWRSTAAPQSPELHVPPSIGDPDPPPSRRHREYVRSGLAPASWLLQPSSLTTARLRNARPLFTAAMRLTTCSGSWRTGDGSALESIRDRSGIGRRSRGPDGTQLPIEKEMPAREPKACGRPSIRRATSSSLAKSKESLCFNRKNLPALGARLRRVPSRAGEWSLASCWPFPGMPNRVILIAVAGSCDRDDRFFRNFADVRDGRSNTKPWPLMSPYHTGARDPPAVEAARVGATRKKPWVSLLSAGPAPMSGA